MFTHRINESVIQRSIGSGFITALLGPRRVGKTTLVEHFMKLNPKQHWIFLTMDIRSDRQRVEAGELRALIEELSLQKIGDSPKLWIAIDEAQKCPALFEQIKVMYDDYKDQNVIKFVLTGSGFLSLHQLSSESLAGRIELYHIREFGLNEAAGLLNQTEIPNVSVLDIICDNPSALTHENLDKNSPYKSILQKVLTTLLIWGGLPEVLISSSEADRLIYLRNYLQTYLEKDIRDVITIADLNLYEKLMDITAAQTGSVREDRRLLDALSCSRETLKKYRGYLEATLVYKEIYPFIGSSLKRLVKSPKGYLTNNGLISLFTGLYHPLLLEKSGQMGARFENWFLNELQIWLDRDPGRSQIYFWRTSAGVEVDFVVEKQPWIFPFEVTYSNLIQPQKVKHLEQFMQEESKAPFGFYIYNGEFKFDQERRIYFLPAWMIG
jgi:uncharacterized protein